VDSTTHRCAAANGRLEITELSPANGVFIGKRIKRDGTIAQYPNVAWWHQSVLRIEPTPAALLAALRDARERNVCWIRGAPANIDRKETRRWIAYRTVEGVDRGDHGFFDRATQLLPIDIDGGAVFAWRADPEGAVRRLVDELGEPWRSTSYVWAFSSSHGLETEGKGKEKRWTGHIKDGEMRLRLTYLTERPLDQKEATALAALAQAQVAFTIDNATLRTVQPNYILRPKWDAHPERDPLGDIATIGLVQGARDLLPVPDDLATKARWARVEGRQQHIPDHPDATAAVLGIGSDGHVRGHLMSAFVHLGKANPRAADIDLDDYALSLANKVGELVLEHEATVQANLAPRPMADVWGYLPDDIVRFGTWWIENIGLKGPLRRKTVKRTKEKREHAKAQPSLAEIRARNRRTVDHACTAEGAPVVALISPAGSGKTTETRRGTAERLAGHPGETVAVLVQRHELSENELLPEFRRKHPDIPAAIWRGRMRDDPLSPDPDHPGKFLKMCLRHEEAAAVEAAMLDVGSTLCQRGRGARKVYCPLFDRCGFQRQKGQRAKVWFGAHELMTHPPPEAFGEIGMVVVDESPLDAFLFGIDINDMVTIPLDALLVEPRIWFPGRSQLMHAREALYRVLDQLPLSSDPHRGTPVDGECLKPFTAIRTGDEQRALPADASVEERLAALRDAPLMRPAIHSPQELIGLEWASKFDPQIRPTMTAAEVRERLQFASGNAMIKKLVTLWQLLTPGNGGRIQLHKTENGRVIRLSGLKRPAEKWNVRTLVLDATGDAELLRAIWPQLECETDEWQMLPRPDNVVIRQIVDSAMSKWMLAMEGESERERKENSIRRVYTALLAEALKNYRGQPVGMIVYKSTREFIEKNLFVPGWLTLMHHGNLAGSNALRHVRALYVIGRPLASAEAVTRLTEAMFGAHIAERDYVRQEKGGAIRTVTDAEGHNTVRVDLFRHPHQLAEHVRRQITEGGIIQALERARTGLRGPDEPLDVLLWTDVALPEIGEVEPILWGETKASADLQMLAIGGVWLESAEHASRAYKGMFTARGIGYARREMRAAAGPARPPAGFFAPAAPLHWFRYQLPGKGVRWARGASLLESGTVDWLQKRLGRIARFEALTGAPVHAYEEDFAAGNADAAAFAQLFD
jgi:hypothetical protein